MTSEITVIISYTNVPVKYIPVSLKFLVLMALGTFLLSHGTAELVTKNLNLRDNTYVWIMNFFAQKYKITVKQKDYILKEMSI